MAGYSAAKGGHREPLRAPRPPKVPRRASRQRRAGRRRHPGHRHAVDEASRKATREADPGWGVGRADELANAILFLPATRPRTSPARRCRSTTGAFGGAGHRVVVRHDLAFRYTFEERIERLPKPFDEIRQLAARYSLSCRSTCATSTPTSTCSRPTSASAATRSAAPTSRAPARQTLRDQFTGTSHHLGQHLIGWARGS